ncbi:hypothetical protein ABZ438_19750 [Streptomyces sp. NPDC005786]|uniref:hypothetical protein n=1 Tax=Streptomyces sp. NPDC005786 TaxID=3154891 RepID=UPI0033E5C2D3
MTDFDRSAFHHRVAVLPWDLGEFTAFVRGDDGTVEHYEVFEGVVMAGPEPLGGHFDSDPVVTVGDDGRLHLLGRSGVRIVDWSWPDAGRVQLLGPPTEETLPGFCVTDPEIVHAGGLQLFALGAEGCIRQWTLGVRGWSSPRRLTPDVATSRPAAISRAPGALDVFAVDGDGALRHWWWVENRWNTEARGGQSLSGRPTVASYDPRRLDLFAVRTDGVPLHWGWDGVRWFDAEERLDMELTASRRIAARDVRLVTFGPELLLLVAGTKNNGTVRWVLEPAAPGRPAAWRGPTETVTSPFPPTAWSTGEHAEVLVRATDGGFSREDFTLDPEGGMGEPVPLTGESEGLFPTEPAPVPQFMTALPADPDMLLIRPDDLVLLGVRWNGFELRTPAGEPAELVPGPAAELTVLFPPQHVLEEVVASGGPAVPTVDPSLTGGFPTWQAALAGASRLVVGFRTDDPPVRLTAEGVLDAVRHGRLVPANGVQDEKTAIEIPYGLVLSPHPPEGLDARATHPADAVRSGSSTVGLWQTTVAAQDTAAGAPAGLILRPVDMTSDDPFPVALRGGSRARIMLEEPTARIDRLTLSSLGGSLTAAGSWDTFEWEHLAALGRDRYVRTATKGVLYPFGHRAEFVELTERVFEGTRDGAVAHLRKSTILKVTEPVRSEPADDALRAAFPFHEVEIERTFYEGLDSEPWGTQDFPVPELTGLLETRDHWSDLAGDLYEKLYGDMGPDGRNPPVEDLADGVTPDADEPLDDAVFDPDDPEPPVTRSSAARHYLDLRNQVAHIDAKIDALPHGGVAPLPVYIVPRVGGVPVDFPVRAAGRAGDVHLAMPLVFVSDIDRPQGLLTPPFNSLTDSDIARRLAETYRDVGDGAVAAHGARIDLVRSSAPVEQDVCEVERLHVVGTPHNGGFRPRLGAAPGPGEQRRPGVDRWAFDTALPAVRALVGADRPPMRLALSAALLDSAPDLKVPFEVPEGADALVTDFARNSARSGGIVAPDIVADGISRLNGPVNVAGLLDRAGGHLDPKKILGDGATLLGYRLSDLIDATALKEPPTILSDAAAGGPPRITLQWHGVKLATDDGSFVTGDDSVLDLDVIMAPEEQTISCTVRNVALALPDRSESGKLLEVSFGSITFLQSGGQPPTLEVEDVGAQFSGLLNLLKELQEGVDLGGAGPHIEASSGGVSASYSLPVPDVTAGAFQLTGLVFHAGIDVPFDDRPVTVSLAFASRAAPFNLAVLMFGGGGYVDVVLDRTGLRRLEAALEFGASVAVNFVVASGEVHAMGGVHLLKSGDQFDLSGYLRLGGHVSIFGLVTVSIEVRITLTYRSGTNELVGRATLVLEIDLTLFSESVELDTGDWVLAGGEGRRQRTIAPVGPGPQPPPVEPAEPAGPAAEEWRGYRSAFGEGPTS